MTIPSPIYQQYFNHLLWHDQTTPYLDFVPNLPAVYNIPDLTRFSRAFNGTLDYIKDQHVLDLGAFTGYLSYIALAGGAKSIHGINIRPKPHEIANFAFSQLGIEKSKYQFDLGDAEDQSYLAEMCEGKNTVLLCKFLGEIKNPMAVLETITHSDVDKIIFHDTVSSEYGPPSLEYRFYSTKSEAVGVTPMNSNMGPDINLVAMPNVPWLTSVLYYYGWKIEEFSMSTDFNDGWFGVPHQADFPPRILNTAHIMARKFK